jgi:uncharacterized membrane protein
MINGLLDISKDIPPELATFIISSLPISELRGGLPAALEVFHLPLWRAFLFSVLGNFFPVIFILLFLEKVSNFLRKWKVWDKFFNRLFDRTCRRFEGKYAAWGSLALVIFVGIPLPMTGAWTGALAAFLFCIPKFRASLLIFLGIILAGTIVTLADLGLVSVFKIFL